VHVVDHFGMNPVNLLGVIQAAIAPVVLISGVGLLLLTLSARLGRIVDRTRLVAAELRAAPADDRDGLEHQLSVLRHRARLIRLSLTLSASAVALVGVVMTLLFLGLVLGWNVTLVCTLLFVAALTCVVVAMFVFVRELSESLVALELSIRSPGG
jgi:ABC-type polysaccharide/polyol phosphate export permease